MLRLTSYCLAVCVHVHYFIFAGFNGWCVDLQVQPGDLLGFIGIDGKLADMHLGQAWTAYSSQGDKTWWPQHGVGHWNYEFYLNAYVSTFKPMVVSTCTCI